MTATKGDDHDDEPSRRNGSREVHGGNTLELVAYQAGAVVSREKAGSVTVFADKAQGLSEHTCHSTPLSKCWTVAEITIGGVPHRLGKDEMILMPANVPHALKAVERFKMMLVTIREATR